MESLSPLCRRSALAGCDRNRLPALILQQNGVGTASSGRNRGRGRRHLGHSRLLPEQSRVDSSTCARQTSRSELVNGCHHIGLPARLGRSYRARRRWPASGPVAGIRCPLALLPTMVVPIPEAAVDEHHGSLLGQYQVRPARVDRGGEARSAMPIPSLWTMLARIMREGAVEGETQEPPCGTNVMYTTF